MSSSTRRDRQPRLRRLAACAAFVLSASGLATALPAAVPADSGGAAAHAATTLKPRTDVDRDGQNDLLFRYPSGAGTMWSTKNLSVMDYTYYGYPASQPKDVIGLGNVRGDSRPEFLQLTADGRLSLHTATATATLAPSWTGTGWQAYDRVVAADDLNRDGRPDLIARTPSGDVFLYRSNGSATGNPFSARAKVASGWWGYDQVIGAGDLDRDGVGDVLARDRSGILWYYKGTGSATAPFKGRVKVGSGWNTFSKIIAQGDQDGDGRADLMTLKPSGDVYYYLSKGGGAFWPRSTWGNGWWWMARAVNEGGNPVYGKNGITGVNAAGELHFHENRSNGLYPSYETSGTFPAGRKLVVATGIDGSGQAAVLAFGGGQLLNVKKNAPVSGDFTTTNLVTGPGDLTGDGRGDLLTRDSAGTLWLRAGQGNGTGFAAPVRVGTGWGAYKALVGSGDVNGDSRTDLIAQGTDGNLYVFPGNGTATTPFKARQLIGSGWNTYNAIAGSGDQNGDGRADIIARDGAGKVYVYYGTGGSGTATFAARKAVEGDGPDGQVGANHNWNVYPQIG
ncbi:FG-GAP repeat domain-containing protein [Streptomyces sp. NPDC093225]|uniref:FG-GAP repeat domain-containing protein n=1 Tax=Streptomyces sp. NPDC093225 TaxID=3366034 RepID=UPI00381639D1